MRYTKPHRPWDEQVKLLKSRGMLVPDDAAAVAALQRIGYYRLSGYSYPFREMAPARDDAGKSSTKPHRLDTFREGTTFDDVVALHDFDDRLRRTLFAGLESLEVALRARIAYRLGTHSPTGHLDRTSLDATACSRPPRRRQDRARTAYDVWRAEYDTLQSKARNEEYVKHFTHKYDGQVPIWAACEFMTMGCLISLFGLMNSVDRRRVAKEFGVKSPEVFEGWLRALNVTRNHCAHNARLWNRSTVYPPDKINTRMVQPDLHHLREADSDKIYFLAALTAYLLRRADPATSWPAEFRGVMATFPTIDQVSLKHAAGFPDGWQDLPLWHPTPAPAPTVASPSTERP